jgi:hypothetical protein
VDCKKPVEEVVVVVVVGVGIGIARGSMRDPSDT